jgi:hypothetical protein
MERSGTPESPTPPQAGLRPKMMKTLSKQPGDSILASSENRAESKGSEHDFKVYKDTIGKASVIRFRLTLILDTWE